MMTSCSLPLCHASLPFRYKSSWKNQGGFSGYASVFHVKDNQNDILVPGAFASIQNKSAYPALLWQHRPETPVGVLHTLYEDERGLFVEGQLALESSAGKETWALLKAGAISGLSIGYTTEDAEYDAKDNIRFLKKVELWEISFVTFPSNAEAGVTQLKTQCVPSVSSRQARLSDSDAHGGKTESADILHELRKLTASVYTAM